MLREVRRWEAPQLGAGHEHIVLRAPSLRLSLHRSRNVASDFALLERASPFIHRLRRPALTIVLEGEGRFEEDGRRAWLRSGQIVMSNEQRCGTEAYAGRECLFVVVSWDPAALGMDHSGAFAVETLAESDRRRLAGAATRLAGPHANEATEDLLALLRSAGLPFDRVPLRDLGAEPAENEQRLLTALGSQLSRLDEHPAIEELATTIGGNVRIVHRQFGAVAERYALPWAHWRSALHHARMEHALQLLAAPGATTEAVARLAGFRSPVALCHAFSKGGLPSPGVLARAARREVLDAWTSFSGSMYRNWAA